MAAIISLVNQISLNYICICFISFLKNRFTPFCFYERQALQQVLSLFENLLYDILLLRKACITTCFFDFRRFALCHFAFTKDQHYCRFLRFSKIPIKTILHLRKICITVSAFQKVATFLLRKNALTLVSFPFENLLYANLFL